MRKDTWEPLLLAALLIGSLVPRGVGQDNVADALDGGGDLIDSDLNATGDLNGTFAPTQAPTIPTLPPSTIDGCYRSLDDIYELIKDDNKLFTQKRYVICPGTVMNVGFLIPGVGIDQGQAPILPRSNTEFLCGEDGKSENDCIIQGGDFGVLAVPVFFRQDLQVQNVKIKGFTFEGQVQYAAFVAVAGDITFEDCIVRDSANFGPMVFNYDATIDLQGRRLEEQFDTPWEAALDYVQRYRDGTLPRRKLAIREADVDDKALLPDDSRQLEEFIMKATIKDCLFTNLKQIERKLGVDFGIISFKGQYHVATIEDCTFTYNNYSNQLLTPIGYGILIRAAEHSLSRLCFVDNDFRGDGAVLLEETADPFAPGSTGVVGNYATEDADLACRFAAWYASEDDKMNGNFTCVNVQTDECGGDPITGASPGTSGSPDTEVASGGGTSGSRSRDAPTTIHSFCFLLAVLAVMGLLVFQ